MDSMNQICFTTILNIVFYVVIGDFLFLSLTVISTTRLTDIHIFWIRFKDNHVFRDIMFNNKVTTNFCARTNGNIP